MSATLPTTVNHTSIFLYFGGSEEAKSASDALSVLSSARAQFMELKLTLTPNMHQTALLHVYNLCCLFLRHFFVVTFQFFSKQTDKERRKEENGQKKRYQLRTTIAWMSIYGDGMPTAHQEFYALFIIIVDDVVIIVIVYIHIHEQTTYSRQEQSK